MHYVRTTLFRLAPFLILIFLTVFQRGEAGDTNIIMDHEDTLIPPTPPAGGGHQAKDLGSDGAPQGFATDPIEPLASLR